MANFCRGCILALLFLIPLLPLLVTPSLFFPFVTGKNIAFRVAVETMLGLYAMLALLNPRYRPRPTVISYAVLVFVLVILIADMLGEDSHRSFWSTYERMDGFVTLAHLAVMYLVATCVLDSDVLWARLWNTSIVVSVMVACYGLLQRAGWLAIYSGGDRIDATFNNASFLAAYLLFHVFLAGMFLLRAGRPVLATTYAAVVAVLCTGIYLTATRGAILGLIVGALVTVALLLRGRRNGVGWRAVAAGFAVCAFAVIATFAALKGTTVVEESPLLSRVAIPSWVDLQSSSRFQVWSISLRAVVDKPLLGWGQENFNYAFDRHFDPRIDSDEQWFDRAHNTPLDWLVAAGLVGFLAYAMLFAAGLHCLWRKSDFDRTSRCVITGLLVAYIVHNLFSFDSIVSYTLLYLMLAFVNSRSNRVNELADYQGASGTVAWAMRGTQSVHAAAIALTVATTGLIYAVNVPAMRSARMLLAANSPQPEGLSKNLELFSRVVSFDSFGRSEAVEQLVNVTTEVTASKESIALKSAFYALSAEELNFLGRRENIDARHAFLAGRFFNHYRQFGAAIPHLQNALRRSPSRPAVHEELGRSYLGIGSVEIAFAEFSAAHDLRPQFPDPDVILASAEAGKAREQGALAAADTVAVIEYGDASSGRFMVTANLAEAFAIDRGERPGWSRTGNSWRAWTAPGQEPGLVPVCRFYGNASTPTLGEHERMLGHYYTSDPADCASRKAAASPRDASERPVGAVAYEGIAFFVHLPNDGVCPLGTTPIYRMRKDDRDVVPNYRFITTRSARRELGAKGWSMDPQSVAFLCGAPPMALSRHLPAGY